ncbi:MAG: hypothetical protein AMXMBFR13_17820 [Phycisphaerae bacterium]
MADELPRAPEHLDAYEKKVLPFLNTWCLRCHNEDRDRGGLRLDTFPDVGAVAREHSVWEHVLQRLSSREMPPRKEKQPPLEARSEIVTWIKAELAHVACGDKIYPGRVTLRRLNRVEYDNTIRDLFAVELNLSHDFPADDSGYGFDNIGDVLSVSPLLMERYLAAAEHVAGTVIVTPEPVPPQVWRFTGAALARGRKSASDEDGPHVLSSNGQIATDLTFPLDGEYTLRVAAYGQQAGPDPVRMAIRVDDRVVATFEVTAELENPQVYETKLQAKAGEHRVGTAFLNDYYQPKHKEPKLRGDRNLGVEYLEIESPPDERSRPLTAAHRRIMSCMPPAAALPSQGVEGKAGAQGGQYPPRPPLSKGGRQAAALEDKARGGDARAGETHGGKTNAGEMARIETCARRILGEVARRAFRRPVSDEEVDRLVGLVELVVADGGSFERGIQLALEAILVSPHFLFLIEHDPPPERIDAEGTYAINDFELASRLSYFLWSSMPDEMLFDLAGRGVLHEDAVLEEQVVRMLADPKSQAFVENFAGQWLELRKLDEVSPDPRRFPEFDAALREGMRTESRRFFEYILRGDRSILEFLLADYTFANERLARHYGLKGIHGEQFRRVALTGERPGGVLAHASVLTITSDPTRTSPVKRGKWVLEQILGTPPPPPPPDVPALDESPQAELKGTLRQRMEQHRTRPDCYSCHSRMDPIGFGLENYDAVGAWRTRDGEFEIDASGMLPEGERFEGPTELQRILLAQQNLFRRCLTQKVLTYALGRGLEYYDRCAVDAICRQVADSGDRMGVLILEIVKSAPFRRRSIREENP